MPLFNYKKHISLIFAFIFGIQMFGYCADFATKKEPQKPVLSPSVETLAQTIITQLKKGGLIPATESFDSSVYKILPGGDFDGQMILSQIDSLTKPAPTKEVSIENEDLLNKYYELYYTSFVDYIVAKDMPEPSRASILHTLQALYTFTFVDEQGKHIEAPMRLPLTKLLVNVFMLNKEQRDIAIIEQAKTKRKQLFSILSDFEAMISKLLQSYAAKGIEGTQNLLEKVREFNTLMQVNALDIKIWRDWIKKGRYALGVVAVLIGAWTAYKLTQTPPYNEEIKKGGELASTIQTGLQGMPAGKLAQTIENTNQATANIADFAQAAHTTLMPQANAALASISRPFKKSENPPSDDAINMFIQKLNKDEYAKFKQKHSKEIQKLIVYLNFSAKDQLTHDLKEDARQIYVKLNKDAIYERLNQLEALEIVKKSPADSEIAQQIKSIKSQLSTIYHEHPALIALEKVKTELAQLEIEVGPSATAFTTPINLSEPFQQTAQAIIKHFDSYRTERLSDGHMRANLIDVLIDLNKAFHKGGGELAYKNYWGSYQFQTKNDQIINALHLLAQRVYEITKQIINATPPWNTLKDDARIILFYNFDNESYGVFRFLQYCIERIGNFDEAKKKDILEWGKELHKLIVEKDENEARIHLYNSNIRYYFPINI